MNEPVPWRSVPGAVLAVVAMTLAGCADDGDSDGESRRSSSPSSSAPSAAAPTPEVEMIDVGEDPATVLRLSPEVGDAQSATTTTRKDVEINGAITGVQLPTTATPFDLEVDAVADDGTIDCELEFGRPVVSGDGPAVDAARMAMADVDGSRLDVAVASRGGYGEPNLKLYAETDDVLGQVLVLAVMQVAELSAVFPEEPVGEGARWRTTRSVASFNPSTTVVIDAVTTFTLESLEDDSYVISYDLDMSVGRGRTSSLVFEGGSGTGSGEITGELDAVLPTSSTATAHVHGNARDATTGAEVTFDETLRNTLRRS